jgi:hypothetical protein
MIVSMVLPLLTGAGSLQDHHAVVSVCVAGELDIDQPPPNFKFNTVGCEVAAEAHQ